MLQNDVRHKEGWNIAIPARPPDPLYDRFFRNHRSRHHQQGQ
jgi:hypothetical protein